MKRVGIYCGSFNPVHKGHMKIARGCIDQNLVDEVWIIPTGAYWDKNDLMPLKDRINMLKLVADDHIFINETYNELPYTYQIFEKLEVDYPEYQFHLILGGDNLPRFDQWRNYEELLKYGFIVLPRDEIKTRQTRRIMKDLHKENYAILKMRQIDISSTFIRNNLDDYRKISRMIDKKVYDYLRSMEVSDAT